MMDPTTKEWKGLSHQFEHKDFSLTFDWNFTTYLESMNAVFISKKYTDLTLIIFLSDLTTTLVQNGYSYDDSRAHFYNPLNSHLWVVYADKTVRMLEFGSLKWIHQRPTQNEHYNPGMLMKEN